MAAKESNLFQIKPPPPPTLNKELLSVWFAWSRMGDREVIREAAAKGSHVNLVITFLSKRKELDVDAAQEWFKQEVFTWISELLSRKQVFKASHILSNINVDPITEFSNLFLTTNDKKLRDYLGNHLLKVEKLSSDYKISWNLLQSIEENTNVICSIDKLNDLNVKCIHEQNDSWKRRNGTKLFFNTYDPLLKPFLTAQDTWEFLLQTNNVELVKLWINIYFGNNTEFKDSNLTPEVYKKLREIFTTLHIKEDMIDAVVQMNLPKELQESVLDELSKFGLFTSVERNDLICILSRMANNENIDSLYKIIQSKESTVTLVHFDELFLKYCIENELYSILNCRYVDLNTHKALIDNLNSKYLNLIYYLRNNNFNFNIDLGENILKISQFLSDDLKNFFINYPLILIAMMLILLKTNDLLGIFNLERLPIYIETLEINAEVITKALTNLPFLCSVLERKDNESVTFYDLLNKHANLNTEIFSFNMQNKVPNFNSETLVKEYGYKKILNYIFYLKQSRPTLAYRYRNAIEDETKIFYKLLKLAACNFPSKEIAAGCIAFLEMAQHNSENFRLYLTGSTILYQSHLFSLEDIQALLRNVVDNSTDFVDNLEKVLINDFSLQFDYDGVDLIEEIKKYGVIVKLSVLHNLKLPELFLEQCAKHDLWLPFLLFVQIYNYPLNVVQKLLSNFSNPNLFEHLNHGLTNDIQIEDQRYSLMRERDSRKYYLSRIGVRKSIDNSSPDVMQSSASSYGSYGSTGSSTGSLDFLETENLGVSTDFLQTLMRCHSSIDPPKALLHACYLYRCPMFAVLATSYEPDSIITNWLTWLSVSCKVEDGFSNFEGAIPNGDYVKELLKNTLQHNYGKTLQESFHIFLPENPLSTFIDFLNICLNLEFDQTVARTKLSQFMNQLKHIKSSGIVDYGYDMMYITNKTWIEETACGLLASAVEYSFISQYNQLRFLKFLHEIEISEYFSIEVPCFQKFYNILSYLFQSKCDIKLDLSAIINNEIMETNVFSCVQELVSKNFYDCAFKIATVQGINTDFIIIKEWENKFITNSTDNEFWKLCDHAFKTAGVNGKEAVNFFERCSAEIFDICEKFKILSLARKWATVHNLDSVFDIERKMWIAYFNVDTKITYCDFAEDKVLYSEMQQKLLNLEIDSTTMLNEETITHIKNTIEKLLDHKDLWQSLRLARIFNCNVEDLDIIILCCNLAEGLVMPYQLNTEQRLLLNKTSNFRKLSHHRRRALMSSRGFSSFSSGSHSPAASSIAPLSESIDGPYQDTLLALEALADCVRSGTEIIHDILLTYRISVNIDKSYQEVFKCKNLLGMLKEALKDDSTNKLQVVHDFSVLFGWTRKQIANLLAEEIIASIKIDIKFKLDVIMLWNINLDTDFHLILQLLIDNCSILGLELYSYASALHKLQNPSKSDFRISEINLVIELLIRSHDCFTADCNMEGISMILRKCRSMISLLLTLKSWKLIVRLLTGVARYTEMNYAFHILRENSQFEFLLRKGNRKDNGLKVALLKYLQKYCPEDRELYRMVALHFTLFSEIAQLWEEEARSIIRNLIAISKLEMQNNGLNIETQPYVLLTNTDGTKICLNKAMINYTHATEYHLQGEKLAKAMNSAKQAELLALQSSMLKGLSSNGTAICILNMNDIQITSIISTELSFPQSLLLIEAYNYKTDWASVLFERYVINNDWNYLQGFIASFQLSDALVNDISRKFINLKAFSDTTTHNMKEIINACASVYTKYRFASELGFTDLVEDLLAGDQLAFLKDTVWKKGYRS